MNRAQRVLLVATLLAASGCGSGQPSTAAHDYAPVRLDDTPTASIPDMIVVNRWGPNALAEVTERYRVCLEVSIDDHPPQPISTDVDGLVDVLGNIVQSCRQESKRRD